MSQEAETFWQKTARYLTRKSGYAPLTPEQAQKEFESLPDLKLSKVEIESTIRQATSGELAVWTPEPLDANVPLLDSKAVEEDVMQLNRHEGETDAETEKLLSELRRKALEDGQPNGQKDATGMDGDSKPPTKGD